MKSSNSDSELTRRRYDRVAFFYDYLESPMEWFIFAPWRARLRNHITGERALEAEVGLGKNLAYYPSDIESTAIDISPRMLERAREKADVLGLNTTLVEMDVQNLFFPMTFLTRFSPRSFFARCRTQCRDFGNSEGSANRTVLLFCLSTCGLAFRFSGRFSIS